MAAKDLNFIELMRYARVQDARFSNDPSLSEKFMDYLKKIQSDSFTQEDFDKCIELGYNSIIKYMKSSSEVYTESNLKKALIRNGRYLQYIPLEKQTSEILRIAFSQDGSSIEFAKKDLLNDDLVKTAINQNPIVVKNILINIYNESIS